MSTNLAASPQSYRESAILTAPPQRLVVMLYDGAHRFLYQAAAATRAGQFSAASDRLRRAEEIISHLQSTLDMSQGEISHRLDAIYRYCLTQTAQARVRKDPERIDEVSGLLAELRSAWDQICSKPMAATA
ncbi:MAG TPA: flagellar export chaperone FliS [Conexibacter sp.]|jgi:flagellar protein FliS